MSVPQYDSGLTSNDLLERRIAENALPARNYQIVAQSAEDVQNVENAPAVSMGLHIRKNARLTANVREEFLPRIVCRTWAEHSRERVQ